MTEGETGVRGGERGNEARPGKIRVKLRVRIRKGVACLLRMGAQNMDFKVSASTQRLSPAHFRKRETDAQEGQEVSQETGGTGQVAKGHT